MDVNSILASIGEEISRLTAVRQLLPAKIKGKLPRSPHHRSRAGNAGASASRPERRSPMLRGFAGQSRRSLPPKLKDDASDFDFLVTSRHSRTTWRGSLSSLIEINLMWRT